MFKKSEKKHSKRRESGSEGYLSAPYVIMEVPPLLPRMCPLHPTPFPDLKPLPSPYFVQPPPHPHSWDWAHDDDNHRDHPLPSSASVDMEGSDDISV